MLTSHPQGDALTSYPQGDVLKAKREERSVLQALIPRYRHLVEHLGVSYTRFNNGFARRREAVGYFCPSNPVLVPVHIDSLYQ
jgi:hypothetical protein